MKDLLVWVRILGYGFQDLGTWDARVVESELCRPLPVHGHGMNSTMQPVRSKTTAIVGSWLLGGKHWRVSFFGLRASFVLCARLLLVHLAAVSLVAHISHPLSTARSQSLASKNDLHAAPFLPISCSQADRIHPFNDKSGAIVYAGSLSLVRNFNRTQGTQSAELSYSSRIFSD